MTETPPAGSRPSNWWPAVVGLLIVAWLIRDKMPAWIHGVPGPRPIAARGDLAADEQATIALFEDVSRSVAYIRPNVEHHGAAQAGTGSGVMWDEAGHLVTNYHVVHNADAFEVTLFDGSAWEGRLRGVSLDKDLAVLHIDAPADRIHPVRVGTSHDLRVGQKVFAIGNPFGFDFTLTTGVVSALDREILSLNSRTIHGVIQTDAAINPGNSGGPLLDSSGRLIGINTAIYSQSGGSSGIGFAVPVDVVHSVVPQIIAHGRVVRPGLGVVISTDMQVAAALQLQGVLILQVQPGSDAARAGLEGLRRLRDGRRVGDIIVAVNGHPTRTFDELATVLEGYGVGETVTVTVQRRYFGTGQRDREVYETQVRLQAIE